MAPGVPKYAQEKNVKPKSKLNIRASYPMKEVSKPQVTISTSKILKRQPLKEVYGKRHSRRHVQGEPKNDLFLDYQEQVELSRDDLRANSRAKLEEAHTQLTDHLKRLHHSNIAFETNVSKQTSALFKSPREDTMKTTFERDGKSITEVTQMGPRVDAFKAYVASKEAEIAKCWVDWETVQTKIVELGVDVLGAEALGLRGVEGKAKSQKGQFSLAMEELERAQQKFLEDMEEHTRIIARDAMKQMTATEKEQNLHLKREQATLIAKIFASDDKMSEEEGEF